MEYHNHVLDYFKWRGNIPLSYDGFNEVDAMVCAELSYLNLEGIVPGVGQASRVTIGDVYQIYMDRINNHEPVDTQAHEVRFLLGLGQTIRYKNLVLSDYSRIIDEENSMQFGAVCIHIGRFLHYISFQGTDNEMVGWRENLNMIHMKEVPSQKEAIKYVNQVMKGFLRKYYIGGHSKGGNLAKYASAFCLPKLQKKIACIYCYDAPGFLDDMLEYPSYAAINDRIKAYAPQGSIVGMLLEHAEGVQIIHSQGEGIGQHDLESWTIQCDSFVPVEKREPSSYKAEAMMTNWLNRWTLEERAHFSAVICEVVTNAGIKTFPELMSMRLKTLIPILKQMKNVSSEDKDLIYRVFKTLIQERNNSKKMKDES